MAILVFGIWELFGLEKGRIPCKLGVDGNPR